MQKLLSKTISKTILHQNYFDAKTILMQTHFQQKTIIDDITSLMTAFYSMETVKFDCPIHF